MAVTSAEQAAAKLAAALNGAGLGLTVKVARWPKYAPADLTAPRWHVVPVFPAEFEAIDDEGSEVRQPFAVTLDARVEKTDGATVEALTAKVEAVAEWLCRNEIPGLGYPIERLVIDRNDDSLDKGHLMAGIGAVYRRFRSADEGAP